MASRTIELTKAERREGVRLGNAILRKVANAIAGQHLDQESVEDELPVRLNTMQAETGDETDDNDSVD